LLIVTAVRAGSSSGGAARRPLSDSDEPLRMGIAIGRSRPAAANAPRLFSLRRFLDAGKLRQIVRRSFRL
jgi:hypothetical protein